MSDGKANVSEPLRTCRKRNDVIETGLPSLVRDEAWGMPVDYLSDGRHGGGASPAQALVWNVGTYRPDAKGRNPSGGPTRMRVPMRGEGADGLVVVLRPGNAGGAKGPDSPAEDGGQPEMGGAGV